MTVQLDDLLKANPKAKKNEKAIRTALRDVRQLRQEGFGGDGYTLAPPFGSKRALGAAPTVGRKTRAYSK
jgi:hypothetical protein